MVCHFNFKLLNANSDKTAKIEVAKVIRDAAYENRHGGYSGSFAEATGSELNKSVLHDSVDDAENWLNERTEKWGPAIIVITKSGQYCVGAHCSS